MPMFRRCFVVMLTGLFLLLTYPLAAQVVQQVDSGQVNWEIGVVRATGIGAPPPRAVSPAQARAMAIRAGQADAYRNLLEVTKGVRVSSTTVVNNFMTGSDTIRLQIEGLVKGARVIDTKYLEDGSVEVTVEMPIYGTKGLSSAIFQAQEPEFQKKMDFVVPKEFQGVKPPSPQDQQRAAEEAARKAKIEEDARNARLEAERQAEEARKKADAEAQARRQAELDTKRLQEEMLAKQREADERTRQEDKARKAREAEQARMDADKTRLAKEREEAELKQRNAEEAARKARESEEKRKAEEAARAAAEETRKKMEEHKAAEEAAQKARDAEAKQKEMDEARRVREEKESKARADELKRIEEEGRRAEEARKKADEEAARKARQAEQRRVEEEAARKAAEEAKKLQELQKKSSDSTADAAIGDVSAFTGAVIDTTGTGAKPAMSPKILVLPPPPPEQEVYGMADADYQIALNAGLVSYSRSIDAALDKQKARIGENPLIIKAVKTREGKASDIIIEYKDGVKLAELDKKNKVLEKCKVVMVIGASKQAMLMPLSLEFMRTRPE